MLTCTISFNLFFLKKKEKGQYRGENFDSALPPHRIFSNASSCKPLLNIFLIPLLIDLLRTGAISPWGRVDEVPPPHFGYAVYLSILLFSAASLSSSRAPQNCLTDEVKYTLYTV